jgi:hypothetical protein
MERNGAERSNADGRESLEGRLPDPADAGTAEGEAPAQEESGEIPVQGDPARAERLEKEAFGDEDRDGEGDAPTAQFPG